MGLNVAIPLVPLKDIKPDSKWKASAHKAVVPMLEPVEVPKGLKRMGEPARVSVFRNADGEACFAVMRWDVDGDKKKTLPVIWDGKAFLNAGFTGPKPLYNSDLIAADKMAPVLVVEGEKAAEDGARYLPDGWLITTWAGGVNNVHTTDWSLLKDRRVVIWPDNDKPGRNAAENIKKILDRAAIVGLSKNYPEAWDLADPLPGMVSESMVTANMMSALAELDEQERADMMDVTGAEAAITNMQPAIDTDNLYRCLGYDNDYFYVMPGELKVIKKFTTRELNSFNGCIQIVNDIEYWREVAPPKKGSSEPNWQEAASLIMRNCRHAGLYDETDERGRGVWEDEGRVVVHTGESIIVDGKQVNPAAFRSKNIYRLMPSFFENGIDPSNEATDAEGRMIVELCNTARWEKEVFGDLLAGYIATSMVCGALRWRTHIWVTGNSGSGKSTVINDIVTPCVGGVALYPLGETTESGIRQSIGKDARPVIFDEMEGTDQSRGNMGDSRRHAIIQLMRMASTEGLGRIMKGTAGHKSIAFTMKSSFLVASIGMALKEAPDLTRTMVLSLKPLSHDAPREERRQASENWLRMNRLTARIPYDMPERLFARMTKMVPVIRANAETFKKVIADRLGSSRLGDQIGTLLAGRCALTSQRVMTMEECDEYLCRFEWNEVIASPSDREDKALLRQMKQATVRLQTNAGMSIESTIGELILIGADELPDAKISVENARRTLLRYGLKYDVGKPPRGIWVAKSASSLQSVMKNSTNPSDWYSVVSRWPDSQKVKSPMRFGSWSSVAVLIPMEGWRE